MKKICKIIAFVFALVLPLSLVLTSCDKKPVESTEVPTVDYVAQVKLDKTVSETSDFFEDGIGFAKLVRNVDGDTTVFKINNTEFKVRYLGVDTPESTGSVEKWGKTASYFTADKLNNAQKIVLQTNGGKAELDTTGSRYLAYVWYLPKGATEYRLLNLELVQEGYSYGKSATASLYADWLIKAQSQAMAKKLHVFGDDKDPNFFDGDAIETTIKYILENQTELLELNAKVVFDCTVVRNEDLYVYVQDKDLDTNEVYSIMLYKGYNLSTNKLEVGNRVSICGNVQEYNGLVQISGMKDIKLIQTKDNIQLISTGYEIFQDTITPSDLKNFDKFDTRKFVKMENVYVKSIYTTQDGSSAGAMTMTCTVGDSEETFKIRTSVLIDENYEVITYEEFLNKTITVHGIVDMYNGDYQVNVVSVKDIIIQ